MKPEPLQSFSFCFEASTKEMYIPPPCTYLACIFHVCVYNALPPLDQCRLHFEGLGGSMSWVVGLSSNLSKPITNTAWVRTRLWKLQKRIAAASYKVHQLIAHVQWFSPGTPASSNTKTTSRHDIAEILLKVTLSTTNQIITFLSTLDTGYQEALYLR